MKRLIVYKPLLRAFNKKLLKEAFNKTNKKHKMVIYGGMLDPDETKEMVEYDSSETKEEPIPVTTSETPEETKEETEPERIILEDDIIIRPMPTETETKTFKEKFNNLIDEYVNVDERGFTKTQTKELLISSINKIIKLHNENKAIRVDNNTKYNLYHMLKRFNNSITRGSKYEIRRNTIGKKENRGDIILAKINTRPLPYETNLDNKKAIEQIKKYWVDNPEKAKLTPIIIDEIYSETEKTEINEINDIIENIKKEETTLFDISFEKIDKKADKTILSATDKKLISAQKFRESFPDKNLSYAYLDTVKNSDNEQVYATEEEKETAYKAAGKAAEYTICGRDNPLAKKIFKLKHPDFQVTDQLVDNIINQGRLFCIDNIDTKNKILSESKDYKTINYQTCYNINIELKKVYYNKLLVDLKELISDYKIDIDNRNTHIENIKIYNDILTNKNEFEKDFYKNRPYIGIGISVNKFSPIIKPDGFIFDENNEERQIELNHVINSQGQLFVPITNNERKIIRFEKQRDLKKIKEEEGKEEEEEEEEVVAPIVAPIVDPTTKEGKEAAKKAKAAAKKAKKAAEKKAEQEIIRIAKADKFDTEFNAIYMRGNEFKYVFTINFSNVLGVWDYTNEELIENGFLFSYFRTGYAEDDKNQLHFNSVVVPIEKIKLIS